MPYTSNFIYLVTLFKKPKSIITVQHEYVYMCVLVNDSDYVYGRIAKRIITPKCHLISGLEPSFLYDDYKNEDFFKVI